VNGAAVLKECDRMSVSAERPRGILDPGAADGRLEFSWYPPSSDLADLVERHWSVRWDLTGEPPFVQEVLPHPGANLCFEPTGASVHGVITRRASHLLEGAGLTVGTMFRPAAFAGFAALPMRELVDRGVSLAIAFGSAGETLERAVERHDRADDRVAAVASFLRERRPPPDPTADLVERIVDWMLAAPAGTRVGDAARVHGLSARELQRQFSRYLGVGPKWVLQRYRLHEAAERIAAGGRGDWAEVAAELGYADQAHFIRDFRAVVGCTPGAYARRANQAPVG
jgi:AraC-like DNA-binding protein